MAKVIIHLNKFTVIKKQDIGKDEPYLWVFGIRVDRRAINDRSYVVVRRPTDGNLGSKFKKGESREIPEDLGRFVWDVDPVFGQLAAGIVVMAWEHDGTPKDAQEAAYKKSAKILNEFIAQRVSELNTEEPAKADLANLKAKIEDKVRKHFTDAVKLFKPGTWNPDDFVGFDLHFTTLDPQIEVNQNLGFGFRGDGAEYKIGGKLTFVHTEEDV